MSVDLHCHSLFSVDGFGTPEALVDMAADRGVSSFSITDHNCLGANERAAVRAVKRGIRYFSGVEFDVVHRDKGFHVLGYGFDPKHPGLNALAERNHACYSYRFEIFFEKLRSLGFPWTREELEAYLPSRYPTHPAPILNMFTVPHFADQEGGLDGFGVMREEAMRLMKADDRYLAPREGEVGRFCRYEEARDAIHAAGGVVVLAHVALLFPDDHEGQEAWIRHLIDEGCDGFELYHYLNERQGDMKKLKALGRELDCLLTGGSDCHRSPGSPPKQLGVCDAPETLADRLDETPREQRRQSSTLIFRPDLSP